MALPGGRLIAVLRSRLKFHAAMGIDHYPANSDLQRFFELTDGKTGVPAGKLTAGEAVLPLCGDGGDGGQEKLALLRQEAAGCRLCHLSGEKAGTVCGAGSPAAAFMVVGDWSLQRKDDFIPDVCFGPDEDVMLWNMMAAIDLRKDDIFVTNCMKCCPGGQAAPDSRSEKSCFTFLEREIALVRPAIICAMGDIAARMLTGSSEPLSRLRGKFVRYRYQSKHELFVMPTYHPRFLLRHSEMKKAAWLDLQAIRKKLVAIR
ncbi:MAG: uracil-DNA glycosylase [Desulfobulbaceae bacterium]|nr:uracil-DNA glycosylase [Desulfobulbaceae bacterium]